MTSELNMPNASRDLMIKELKELELKIQEKSNTNLEYTTLCNDLTKEILSLITENNELLEPCSSIGEVIKVINNFQVLVSIDDNTQYLVEVEEGIKMDDLKPKTRVALRGITYEIHKILPIVVDPLVKTMMMEKVPDTTYDMIGGLDKQIMEIKEVIELPMKNPEIFQSLGIEQPKGVLLYGPPGTGKTLLARAVAHHTDCTFIRISGSELVQKYVGEGPRMVREIFKMAKQHSPAIIFMDEVDSIGSARTEGDNDSDNEVQRTMSELLTQLDGFEHTSNIKVIMATNRIDILDSSLLRPGRIDKKINFPKLDIESRTGILKIHSQKMNMSKELDLKAIATLMAGASGAEIKGVCTEAGMFAIRERRTCVTQEDFEMAVTKVLTKENCEISISVLKFMK